MRKILLPCILLLACLAAGASALDVIDAAVREIGGFVVRAVPDRNGVTVSVGPVLSDELGKNLLGDRLQSELELYLATGFTSTRIAEPPGGRNNYLVSGEIQAYPGRVRIIVKIFKPDGTLLSGTRAELALTPEIEELLLKTGPAGRLPASGPEAIAGSDPYEPDDLPGSEVEVTEEGSSSFVRFLAPGDIDRFRFYLEQPTGIVLETAAEVDTQILLYREGENIPFLVNDNSRGFTSSRLEASLEPGYYIAEVFAYDFDIQGPYTMIINLSGMSNDSYEPDNTLEEARPLPADSRQDRYLLSGDRDYVELVFKQPGFYTLHTSGVQVDTRLALFDETENLLLEDQDSGELFNAQVGLFLGTMRVFARVEAQDPLLYGAYTLALAAFVPPQVYPNGDIRTLEPAPAPHYLKLRILQAGNYALYWKAASGETEVNVYSLPSMRGMGGQETADGLLISLKAGDYLVAVSSAEPETIRLCIAEEGSADNCKRRLRE